MDDLGLTAAILPELHALHGVEQNRYHHADVYAHTIEVLEQAIGAAGRPGADVRRASTPAPSARCSPSRSPRRSTAAFGLRLGALLHDVAKPAHARAPRRRHADVRRPRPRRRRAVARDPHAPARGREAQGARRRRSTRHHLRLGFLVHERPLARRALYRYLRATEPVEVDVTLLSVADRLATRGRKAPESIAKHLELAREVLPAALAWRAQGRRVPLVRGDALAAALGLDDGPRARPAAGRDRRGALRGRDRDAARRRWRSRRGCCDAGAAVRLRRDGAPATPTACSARSSPARSPRRSSPRTSARSPSWTSTRRRAATRSSSRAPTRATCTRSTPRTSRPSRRRRRRSPGARSSGSAPPA